MILLKKARTARRVFQHEGISGLLKVIRQRLNPPPPVEMDETKLAFTALRADQSVGIMVDVGAHHGGAMGPFAHCGWTVYAFEPDSRNRARLLASFGEMLNVRIDPRAVSDRPQQAVTLYRSEQSTGISALSAFHPSHVAGETVEVITLASFLTGEKVAVVDFLKTDTEGYDLFVLRGVPWEKLAPRLILCEFDDAKSLLLGYTFHDLARFLQEKGYQILVSEWQPIHNYGESHKWRCFVPYPCEIAEAAWGNLLAAREESLYQALVEIGKTITPSR